MAEMEALVPGATERVARGEVIPSYLIETKGKLGWETQQLMAGMVLSTTFIISGLRVRILQYSLAIF